MLPRTAIYLGLGLIVVLLGLPVGGLQGASDQAESADWDRASEPGVIRLLLGGDLLLDLGVGQALDVEGPAAVLGAWGQVLAAYHADLGFANLESPVSDLGHPLADKRYTFRADPARASELGPAGFHVLSLANNHTLDFGPDALCDTLTRLEQGGVVTVGAGRDRSEAYRPRLVEVGETRVAWLAFTDTFAIPERYREWWGAGENRPGTALLGDVEAVLAAVREARVLADAENSTAAPTGGVVVVSVHWGYEYLRRPAAADRRLAHRIIEAGADLVVGHHPHVTQGIEVHQGRLIFYSLGNLLFDSDRSPDRTAAALVTLERDPTTRGWATTGCRVLPLVMDRTHLVLPAPADPGALALLGEIGDLSRELGTHSRLEAAPALDGLDLLALEGLPRVDMPRWAGWQPR